jgi:hypothetical protein
MVPIVDNSYTLDVFPLLICVSLHMNMYTPRVRCNSEYQVYVMERVRYVG